jgi:hypothetical protein
LTVFEQVASDMTVLTPFVCLPIFYMTRVAVADESLLDGLQKYVGHVHMKVYSYDIDLSGPLSRFSPLALCLIT